MADHQVAVVVVVVVVAVFLNWKKEEKDDQYLVDCSKLYLWMAEYSLTEAYNLSLSLSLSISLFPSKQNTGESGKLGVVFEMVVGLLSFLPDWSLT